MYRQINTLLRKLSISVLAIVFVLAEGGTSWAQKKDIELVINPSEDVYYAGLDSYSGIVITIENAEQSNLNFIWKLNGVGKLDAEGPAAFYEIPGTIEKESEEVTITVTIINESAEVQQKELKFTIRPSSRPTPTPTQGIGTGTKIAIGAGVAALVGGVAIIAANSGGSSSTPKPCTGAPLGGYCWHLGVQGQPCDVVCSLYGHEEYDEATRTYAGSEGSDDNCLAVLNALSVSVNSDDRVTNESQWAGLGCSTWNFENRQRWTRDVLASTDPRASYPTIQRACACKN